MDGVAPRGRQDQIRSAKRALRQFQRRRAQEQSKRASRTLRASVLVQGTEKPTIVRQSLTATNVLGTVARESAVRATDKSRRRLSRPSSIRFEDMSDPPSRRSSRTLTPGQLESLFPSSRDERRMSTVFPALRGPSDSRRSSMIIPTPAPENRRRVSRHSRQFSIATRGEGFELMSGQPLSTGGPRSSRYSVRMSSLEPASQLFGHRASQKPLPPIPSDWRAALQHLGELDSDSDADADRTTALEKLEGRYQPGASPATSDKTSRRRAPVPSWLGLDNATPRSATPTSPTEASPVPELSTVQEVDEVSTSLISKAPEADESSSQTKLRPLRLGALSSTPSRPSAPASASVKAAHRVSSLPYRASVSLDEAPASHQHQAKSSRSAQSTTISWPPSEQAGSLFSPESNISDSPGATSIDSAEHTPRKRMAHSDDYMLEAWQHRFTEMQNELSEQRERHLHEVTALQRELDDMRQMMGSQIVTLTQARDKAEARIAELERQMEATQVELQDTSGERDMYREDIGDWRTRCSDLEQTIQAQQLRLEKEKMWRQMAQARMQTLRQRLQTSDKAGLDMSPSSSFSTTSSLLDVPELPELPEQDDPKVWAQNIARQLSKHTPSHSESLPDLTPEAVQLVSDMREQILALYASLQLEQSQHALTREQLRMAQAPVAKDADEPVSSKDTTTPTVVSAPWVFTPADKVAATALESSDAVATVDEEEVPTPTVLPTEASEPVATESTPAGSPDTSTADILFAGASDVVDPLVGLGLGDDAPATDDKGTGTVPEHMVPSLLGASAEITASHAHSWSQESLGLSTRPRRPPSEPATPRDTTDLFTTSPSADTMTPIVSEPAWPDIEASYSMEEPPVPALLASPADLEGGLSTEDSVWVSDEDEADASAWVDDDANPPTPRPEFIPEWSFEQATYEAARDVQVFELSGNHTSSRYARRGARRVRRTPVEDFFGILHVEKEALPPLPTPTYALDMPPVDMDALSTSSAPGFTPKVRAASLATPTASRLSAVQRGSALNDDSWTSLEDWQPAAKTLASEAASFVSHMFSGITVSSPPTSYEYADNTALPSILPCDVDEEPPQTPTMPMSNNHLAPSIPPPSSPIPRSPSDDSPAPREPGRLRYVKCNPQTRIPVPSPIWELDFTYTTSTPGAARVFTI
ncbi:hypothetical protein ACI68E_002326 [Malassezia pachydermatis]|uniref:Uncharacterized protein n=1 Tax=Malassezia pachydermatis TaxID=77020 RepID=A0A0M8MWR2_9BASI|nr:hypothetical protein Malapachy_0879 [Malassezia pachydermatis]KOS15121.1 hypothetical protein Malapachy_0879 [Malassezia pachydermatis]